VTIQHHLQFTKYLYLNFEKQQAVEIKFHHLDGNKYQEFISQQDQSVLLDLPILIKMFN
jgi:hypothetical protein